MATKLKTLQKKFKAMHLSPNCNVAFGTPSDDVLKELFDFPIGDANNDYIGNQDLIPSKQGREELWTNFILKNYNTHNLLEIGLKEMLSWLLELLHNIVARKRRWQNRTIERSVQL